MSGVFLSYSRTDGAFAAQIVHGLRAIGMDVWWDQDMPGVDWQQELERQINTLAGVVVLWTPNSLPSNNVRDEARLGLGSDKLINALVGIAQPPFPFDRVNGLPLDGWTGREPHQGWTRLVETIEVLMVKADGASAGSLTGALARREHEIRLKRQAVAEAQGAFEDAQARVGDTAEFARTAGDSVDRADQQMQRVADMGAAPLIRHAAQQELDGARAGAADADLAHRTARAQTSEASRALARAKAALENLLGNAVTPRPPSPIDSSKASEAAPPKNLLEPNDPAPPPSPWPRLAQRLLSPTGRWLVVAAGVVVAAAVGVWALSTRLPTPPKTEPIAAVARFPQAPVNPPAARPSAAASSPAPTPAVVSKATMPGAAAPPPTKPSVTKARAASAMPGGDAMAPADSLAALTDKYRPAAQKGDAKAQHMLGVIYMNSGDATDAVMWLGKAAEQGDIGAQMGLGAFYQRGEGVGQDYAKALNYYQLAAKGGSAPAKYNIGMLYANGFVGRGRDNPAYRTKDAYDWMYQAAAQGYGPAQAWLAQHTFSPPAGKPPMPLPPIH